MSSKEEILKFIVQPDNISIALETHDYCEELIDDVHRKFWPIYNHQMQSKLNSSEFNDTWDFSPYPTQKPLKGYQKSYLSHKKVNVNDKYLLLLGFGQGEGSLYQFMWSVRWSEFPAQFDHSALLKLKEKLRERHIRQTDPDPRWIFWDYTNQAVKTPEFIRRMYLEPEAYVSEIVNSVWELFLDIEPEIEVIHKEVNRNA